MSVTCILFFLFAYQIVPGWSIGFEELSQLLQGQNCSSLTNCTFREVNADSKCTYIKSVGKPDSAIYLISRAQNAWDDGSAPLSDFDVWAYSIGSAFFISLSGLWGYLLLPLLNGSYRDHVMNLLVGLSCGSLVTSSLCQLIPEAYELGELSPDYLYVTVYSMVGLWVILFVQSFAFIMRKSAVQVDRCLENSKIQISNSEVICQKPRNGGVTLPLSEMETTRPLFGSSTGEKIKSKMNTTLTTPTTVPAIDNEMIFHSSTLRRRCSSFRSIPKNAKLTELAVIILAGDFMNNFLDGISIGAGYSYHLSTGLKLSTAISFEEYTHKLGDFAIVFQSGISMKRALFWNYITSCACFLGVIIGIVLGNLHCSKYIFSFSSGLFLYIALSNMIPEMQNMLKESLYHSRKLAIISLIEQHTGFILAFVALLIISILLSTQPNSLQSH